ncbi:MAG: formyltransferase family protein [Bdellovibrionia bacterium]
MRTLLVTSQITYVPRNYQALFEGVLKSASSHIAGLVVLENLSWRLSKDILGLKLMGCSEISRHLFKNVMEARKRERERLFESKGLPVIRTQTMNSPEIIEYVKSKRIDLIVNARTRCIYKKPILEAPRLGCINIHHGLLPEYRGTLCDLYALFEGRPAGFTIHQMNEKIDAGKILKRIEVSGHGEKDFAAYLEKASLIEGQVLGELLNDIAAQDSLPAGIENRSEKSVYTRNPNRKQIAKMKEEGLVL